MHIPEQASAIHGIYDDDVKDCPTFKEIAKDLARYIEGVTWGDIIRIVLIFHYWRRNFACGRGFRYAETEVRGRADDFP